jgi:hypothetical protein
MGNVALITLYQDTEAAKEMLYQHFLRQNVVPSDPAVLDRERIPNRPITEVLELPAIKARIIDFVHQNLDTLSDKHFDQLLKRSLNRLRYRDRKSPFRFLFFISYSSLGKGFSAIKSLFESMNQKIANSMFIIVINDSGRVGLPITDDECYEQCLGHPEIKGLTNLSDKDEIVVNLPQNDRHKDHILRAIRISPGCFLNEYPMQPVTVGKDESELIIGSESVEFTHKTAELIKNPRIEQLHSQASQLDVGNHSDGYQRIQDEGEQRNFPWYIVLMVILAIILAVVLYEKFK